MGRLCERPGCSQPADVIYGIDADHLTVWIESFDGAPDVRVGVLCRRHADAMVVPLGWMLDDRREAEPRLFRPREAPPVEKLKPKRPKRHHSDDTDQLEFPLIDAGTAPEDTLEIERPAAALEHDQEADDGSADSSAEPAWKPVFDQTDDLGGLLKAKSPLLSRAFGKREQR